MHMLLQKAAQYHPSASIYQYLFFFCRFQKILTSNDTTPLHSKIDIAMMSLTRMDQMVQVRRWCARLSFFGRQPCRPNVQSPCPGPLVLLTSWIPTGAPRPTVSALRTASATNMHFKYQATQIISNVINPSCHNIISTGVNYLVIYTDVTV